MNFPSFPKPNSPNSPLRSPRGMTSPTSNKSQKDTNTTRNIIVNNGINAAVAVARNNSTRNLVPFLMTQDDMINNSTSNKVMVTNLVFLKKKQSVSDLRKQYEEMVQKLNSGNYVWKKRPAKRNSVRGKVVYPAFLTRFLKETKAKEDADEQLKSMFLPAVAPSTEKPASNTQIVEFTISTLTLIPIAISHVVVDPPPLGSSEIEQVTHKKDYHVVTLNSLEDFTSIFLESRNDGAMMNNEVAYCVALGNNSLGNKAFMDFTKLVREKGQKTVFRVSSLDLSWNDLDDDGIISFGEMIELFSGLSQIKLDGNQIGGEGIESLLWKLSKSKNISNSIELSLRETSLGDDGVSRLGNFLKENRLPITLLDLTNSCIYDAVTALALSLHENTTLHTLVIDDNMISNQGAFALGEALLVNTHLHTLRLRNCDIGAPGTTRLCDGLRVHPSLKLLDVELNPWEVDGEIQLLELSWSLPRPDLKIKWREAGWDYGADELLSLVNHFSSEGVLDRLIDDLDSFYPLSTPDQLLKCDLIASCGPLHVATRISYTEPDENDTQSPSYSEIIVKCLNILVLLAEYNNQTVDIWSDALTIILPLFNDWLDHAKTPLFSSNLIHIKILQLFTALVKLPDPHIAYSFLPCLDQIIENLFLFTRRNVYQHHVEYLIEGIVTTNKMEGLRDSICHQMVPRLMELVEEDIEKPVAERGGLFAFAIQILPLIGPLIDQNEWRPFENKYILPYKKSISVPFCGGPPPREDSKKQKRRHVVVD